MTICTHDSHLLAFLRGVTPACMILHFTNYRHLSARLGISLIWIGTFRNSSTGIFGTTDADEQAGFMLQYPQREFSSLSKAPINNPVARPRGIAS